MRHVNHQLIAINHVSASAPQREKDKSTRAHLLTSCDNDN
jgi:hypothetical protein